MLLTLLITLLFFNLGCLQYGSTFSISTPAFTRLPSTTTTTTTIDSSSFPSSSSSSLFGSITSGGSESGLAAPDAIRNHLGIIAEEGQNDIDGEDPSDYIKVRFVNPPNVEEKRRHKFPDRKDGKDIVILAKKGTNLLKLGDKNGVHIPRACRTGLCGTCTADLIDPTWPGGGDLSGEPGLQNIRCCSTAVTLPQDCEEMVIDLYRNSPMENMKGVVEQQINPMKRFDDGWETAYVADYQKENKVRKQKGAGAWSEPAEDDNAISLNHLNEAPWDKLW